MNDQVVRAGRPIMPSSYGLHDAPTGEVLLPWSWAEERLHKARNYWVASTRPDGRPHSVPVWGLWLDGAFYFSTDRRSRKARNLAQNPDVVVHLESGDEVLILEGKAVPVTDAQLLVRYADAYFDKYQYRPDPEDPGSLALVLRPRLALAWLEHAFPSSATRWRFSPE